MVIESREELEAIIWELFRLHRATIPNAGHFVEDLLEAVDAYSTGDSDHLTALRRGILRR